MASDKSGDYTGLQGLLIPDVRLDAAALWSAQSTFNQANPKPGIPVPGQATSLTLQATGAQAAAKDYTVEAVRGGRLPGASQSVNGAGYAYKSTAEADTLLRGHDTYTMAHRFEFIEHSVTAIWSPHAITLANGRAICCYTAEESSTDRIKVTYRDLTDASWTTLEVEDTDLQYSITDATDDSPSPTMVQLPSGRVLLFWADKSNQVNMHWSDDNGATWSDGPRGVLATATANSQIRLRACYHEGSILLFVDTVTGSTPTLYQYASDDLGHTFTQIGSDASTLGGACASTDFGIVVAWRDLATGTGEYAVLGNAWVLFSSAGSLATDSMPRWASVGVGGRHNIAGDFVVDDDGTIWWFSMYLINVRAMYSRDPINQGFTEAETPASNERGPFRPTDNGATGETSAWCIQAGTVRWFGNYHTATSGLIALGVMSIGGYSTQTMPSHGKSRKLADQASCGHCYIPIELPANYGLVPVWTATGAATQTLTSTGLRVQTTGADTRAYEFTPTGTLQEGLECILNVQVDDGGDVSSDDVAMRVRLDDGTNGYDVSIRLTTTQIRLYDNVATADIATVSVNTTAGLQIKFSMDCSATPTGRVKAWYRIPALADLDKSWTAIGSSTSLSDNSGASGSHMVKFGHIAAATADSRWALVWLSYDDYLGNNPAGLGVATKTDLHPRLFSASATRVGTSSEVKITAIGGPAWQGDTWTIATRYEYEWQRMLPAVSASPRVRWRSTDETAQSIALYLDTTLQGTAESMPGNDLIAIGLFGINWRLGKLQRYDVGTAAWVDLVTLDAASGMSTIHYQRRGQTVIPSAGTQSDEPYLYFDEMAGGTFKFNGTYFRKIAAHSEGAWTSNSRKLCTMSLTGVDDNEPASGLAGEIWAPNMVCMVNLLGERGSSYRLVIDAQTTADGYFEIGNIVLGSVAFLGHQYSWGRVSELASGTEVTVTRDRISRSVVRSPSRRMVELAWTDGVDMSQASGATPDPDYIRATTSVGGEPVASPADTPLKLDGLYAYLDGAHRPMVYLPSIQKNTDTQVFNRKHQMMLCRQESPLRIETVQGNEGTDEVARVATVTLGELV